MERKVEDLELEPEARDSLPNVTDQASHEESKRDSESSQQSIAHLRDRVPTEKGTDYRKQLLERELNRTLYFWQKELENAESALADTSNMSIFQ